MIHVNHQMLSFKEVVELSKFSARSVLLLRHSYRKSLKEGGLDPGLTQEGWEYARQCGTLLKGMTELSFGASPRRRTFETVKALMEGGNLGEDAPIVPYGILHDTALFSPPELLGSAIAENSLIPLLQRYFSTGSAPGMIPVPEYASSLAKFLTETPFAKKNVILGTHDIILIALLSAFKVYPFTQEDWCGYVQGAFLAQDGKGTWTIYYTVPDIEKRQRCRLFV